MEDNMTLGQIEQIFLDYLKDNNINIEVGSKDYTDYIVKQMFEKADANLMNHPDYRLIHSYFAEYLYELEKYQLEPYCEKFTMAHVKDKTIKEIKEEIINQDEKIKEKEDKTFELSGYNPYQARDYAYSWYNRRNPAYNTWPFDCTNFISQCIYTGGVNEHLPSSGVYTGVKETTDYWYSERVYVVDKGYRWAESTSWIRVVDFYAYWASRVPNVNYVNNTDVSVYGEIGDVVQLMDSSTLRRYHTTIITKKENGIVYLTYHTADTKDKRIDEFDDEFTNWTLFNFFWFNNRFCD
ncbi:hypothetical protein Y919_06370, partial [Caloranaerobacter azorensis H53214]